MALQGVGRRVNLISQKVVINEEQICEKLVANHFYF